VQFRDADAQRLAGLPDDLLDRKLESISIALLFGEGTKLATQDAIVRVVDITIDDVTGP